MKLRTFAMVLFFICSSALVYAQSEPDLSPVEDQEQSEEELVPAVPIVQDIPDAEVKTEEPREGETRWDVQVTGGVILNYVFSDSPDAFLVKYRWEAKGQANSETAVIKGEASISADVEGPLAKWPTGECDLSITVSNAPFEMTFRKTSEEKTSINLVFKNKITEDWQSKCSFTDAPGAQFNTRGSPEMWLAKALEKARPPLKDLVANLGEEETTTTFVISKEEINDPPVGTIEMEGTGVITIRPGG